MIRRFVECGRCGRHRPHRARGLCDPCHATVQRACQLDAYPSHPSRSMDVDDVVVERALAWLDAYHRTRFDERSTAGRPTLTRGERIAVLARTGVPTWIALKGLGIGGRYARRYLDEAGVPS